MMWGLVRIPGSSWLYMLSLSLLFFTMVTRSYENDEWKEKIDALPEFTEEMQATDLMVVWQAAKELSYALAGADVQAIDTQIIERFHVYLVKLAAIESVIASPMPIAAADDLMKELTTVRQALADGETQIEVTHAILAEYGINILMRSENWLARRARVEVAEYLVRHIPAKGAVNLQRNCGRIVTTMVKDEDGSSVHAVMAEWESVAADAQTLRRLMRRYPKSGSAYSQSLIRQNPNLRDRDVVRALAQIGVTRENAPLVASIATEHVMLPGYGTDPTDFGLVIACLRSPEYFAGSVSEADQKRLVDFWSRCKPGLHQTLVTWLIMSGENQDITRKFLRAQSAQALVDYADISRYENLTKDMPEAHIHDLLAYLAIGDPSTLSSTAALTSLISNPNAGNGSRREVGQKEIIDHYTAEILLLGERNDGFLFGEYWVENFRAISDQDYSRNIPAMIYYSFRMSPRDNSMETVTPEIDTRTAWNAATGINLTFFGAVLESLVLTQGSSDEKDVRNRLAFLRGLYYFPKAADIHFQNPALKTYLTYIASSDPQARGQIAGLRDLRERVADKDRLASVRDKVSLDLNDYHATGDAMALATLILVESGQAREIDTKLLHEVVYEMYLKSRRPPSWSLQLEALAYLKSDTELLSNVDDNLRRNEVSGWRQAKWLIDAITGTADANFPLEGFARAAEAPEMALCIARLKTDTVDKWIDLRNPHGIAQFALAGLTEDKYAPIEMRSLLTYLGLCARFLPDQTD